jgi:tetratricopeptide (TPR) repeat protein
MTCRCSLRVARSSLVYCIAALLFGLTAPRAVLADVDREQARQHLLDKARQEHKDARYEEALTALEEAYRIKPAAALLLTMGNAHLLLVQPEQALELFRRYREQVARPKHDVLKDLERSEATAGAMHKALLAYSQGLYGEAAEQLTAECTPDEIPRVYLHLAAARRKQGRLEVAKQAYAQYLSHEPNGPLPLRKETQEAIAQIDVELGRHVQPATEKPWYRRAWIWGVLGGAVVVGAAVAAGVCGRPGSCAGEASDPPGLRVDALSFPVLRVDTVQF